MKSRIAEVDGIKFVARDKEEGELSTTITFMFRAMCPVPVSPNPYSGNIQISFRAQNGIDFQAVKDAVDGICLDGLNSAEDVVDRTAMWLKRHLSSMSVYTITLMIPEQPFHLNVKIMRTEELRDTP